MKTIIITLLSLFASLLFIQCLADSWPRFNVPDPMLIMDTVVKSGCPAGSGRMPSGTNYRIPNSMPRTQVWAWEYSGDSGCQKLPDDPTELRYMAYEQDGYHTGNTIKVTYGLTDGSKLFEFIFKIPECAQEWGPGECEWFCGPNDGSDLPTTFACALDQSSLPKVQNQSHP